MAEFIERDKVIALFDERKWQGQICIDAVKEIPAADVAAVRHGRWVPTNMGGGEPDEAYVCSACGEAWFLASGTPEENNMNYCPHCGARIDEDIGRGEMTI